LAAEHRNVIPIRPRRWTRRPDPFKGVLIAAAAIWDAIGPMQRPFAGHGEGPPLENPIVGRACRRGAPHCTKRRDAIGHVKQGCCQRPPSPPLLHSPSRPLAGFTFSRRSAFGHERKVRAGRRPPFRPSPVFVSSSPCAINRPTDAIFAFRYSRLLTDSSRFDLQRFRFSLAPRFATPMEGFDCLMIYARGSV